MPTSYKRCDLLRCPDIFSHILPHWSCKTLVYVRHFPSLHLHKSHG